MYYFFRDTPHIYILYDICLLHFRLNLERQDLTTRSPDCLQDHFPRYNLNQKFNESLTFIA